MGNSRSGEQLDGSGRNSDDSSLNDRHALLTKLERKQNNSYLLQDLHSRQKWLLPASSPSKNMTKKVAISTVIFLTLIFSFSAIWMKYSPKGSTGEKVYSPGLHDDYILSPDWTFTAEPKKREYRWTVKDHEHNPDGIYRPMMLINGQFPGPLIECNEGDTIVVHVKNQAMNATSFHWHGIYQNGTNWMDGTVGVTQCPVAPGREFTYEFKILGQAGTYWYHSHQGTQLSDGLFGPLVVHSRKEQVLRRIKYATDRVVMIQDHYHELSGALLMRYLEPDRENAEPVPDGALINGINARNCDAFPHRRCNNSTSSSTVLNLGKHQSHRLRFINVGAFAEFQIQIDEHKFAVTETDGTDVEPAYYHRLNISPGQRYSIVITPNLGERNSFWMRARMVTACFAEENPYLEPEIRAIVQYTLAAPTEPKQSVEIPSSKDWSDVVELECKDMNTTELIPADPVPAPAKVDASFYLRSNFEIGAWKLSRGFFNSSSWRADVSSPSLNRYVQGHATGKKSFTNQITGVNEQAFDPTRELVIQVEGIQTIDILIDNFDDGNHPLHLHGYKYFVLAQGHGYFDPHLYETMNLSNPLRRDTASVEAFGWILIRLVTDNAGFWAFHCHISWHTEAGLLMHFLTRPDLVREWVVPDENRELCEAEGLAKGSGPKDEIWFGNLG